MNCVQKILTAAAMLVPLAGCWHVPMSSLWRLRQLDVLTLDPGAIRLAVLAPSEIEAPPGHVHVRVVGHAGEADERDLTFDLVESRDPQDLLALQTEPLRGFARPGAHFGVFRLSAADVAQARALQDLSHREKAEGGSHRGKIFLTAEPCRSQTPPEPARVDLFLRTTPKEEFFQILEDVDLRDPELWPGKNFETAIPPCVAPATKASDQRGAG